jgi:hypothetical protein
MGTGTRSSTFRSSRPRAALLRQRGDVGASAQAVAVRLRRALYDAHHDVERLPEMPDPESLSSTRETNYDGVIVHYEAHTYDPLAQRCHASPPYPEEFLDEQRVGATIALYATVDEALEFVGARARRIRLGCVYDFDTAQKMDLEISTPIVARANVQGVSGNPIAE